VRPSAKTFAALLAALCATALAAGCGRERPDIVNGKEKFVQKCASCHVLERANATGVQGPNLDEAFGPSLRDGFGKETIQGVVEEQIAIVRRGSSMPANLVTGDDRRDVAAYVAAVAGQPGQDTGELAQAGRPDVSNKVATAKNGRLDIDADPSGALAFTHGKAVAKPGEVTLIMDNPANIPHNIGVQGGEIGPVVGPGGTSRATEKLKAGKYTFLCTVPGHSEGGMKGELTVR